MRDAGTLESVSHITSVSGGSVLAAHLVLNWDRYNGAPEEFESAAEEVLDFVRLDVRNRILRRYPFTKALSYPSRLLRRGASASLSLTGLLRDHYQDHLFGDTCLFELPKRPELHILSTSLSEGGLCSFNRHGLWFEHRSKSGGVEMREQSAGLATVPMAVAASSAFPALFPPLELTAEDIGATEGEFPTHYFTDGGVYDNLGVRMFSYLSQQKKGEFSQADFADVEAAVEAWNNAIHSSHRCALGRITELLHAAPGGANGDRAVGPVRQPEQLLATLQHVVTQTQLAEDPLLCKLVATRSPSSAQGGGGQPCDGEPSLSSRLPDNPQDSNRQLLAMAFEHAPGGENRINATRGFEAVIVSDAGKKFSVTRPDRSSSILNTAMRSSDILMDRVWQLERENFEQTSEFIFAPITDVVRQEEDPSAMHPEIQVQVSRIRTDMDRFNDREIHGLVRHGYCVARRALAYRPALVKSDACGAPWNPLGDQPASAAEDRRPRRGSSATSDTAEARALRDSSRRRVFSAAFAWRDWVSYLYIPLLALLLGVIPYFAHQTWRHVRITSRLTNAVAETRPDFGMLLQLVEQGAAAPWQGAAVVDVDQLAPLFADQGLDIVTDSRIVDLRGLASGAARPGDDQHVYVCRLVTVRKTENLQGKTGLVLHDKCDIANLTLRCQNPELSPTLLRCKLDDAAPATDTYAWQLLLDFSRLHVGATTHVLVESIFPIAESTHDHRSGAWWDFEIDADPEVVTSWTILPDDWRYRQHRIIRFAKESYDNPELVEPTHHSSMLDGSVLHWSVVHPSTGHTYSYRWGKE